MQAFLKRRIMKNQYKRLDIFQCNHEAHKEFGNIVSVYHVLKEKGCYPNGCIYFKWLCKKLNRGLPCPKSFTHVGKKCPSCADYYDEKIIKQPHLLVSTKEYQLFCNDLRKFENWLMEKIGKQANCAGTIKSIKPHYIMHHQNNRQHLSFKGFLLIFKEAFIDITHFEDTIYAHILPWQQTKLKLAEGDKLEFLAKLRLDRGRIVLDKLHQIEIEEKISTNFFSVAEAKQALIIGKVFDYQWEKCLNCPHGCLVDIKETDFSTNGHKRRKLLCLKGVSHPEHCIIQIKEKLFQLDYCQKDTTLTKKEVS